MSARKNYEMQSTEVIPATSRADIAEALAPLLRTMPSKGKVQDRMEGYFIALARFSIDDIEAGIRKFLSGEVVGVKTEFVPPPQLAQIVRDAAGIQEARRQQEEISRLYQYKTPNSPVVERHCTKAWARQLIENHVHERGCIWCPAPLGDDQTYGDLYAPDPAWTCARLLNAPPPDSTAEPIHRPLPRYGVHPLLDFSEPRREQEPQPQPQPPQIHDYSQETTIEASPFLLKQLEDKRRSENEFAEQFPAEEG